MSAMPEHIETTLSERMANTFVSLTVDQIGSAARAVAVKDLIDMAGLCIAARRETYVRQIVEGWDSDGSCTAEPATFRECFQCYAERTAHEPIIWPLNCSSHQLLLPYDSEETDSPFSGGCLSSHRVASWYGL